MIGIYLIAAGTVVLVASTGWEYYAENVQSQSNLEVTASGPKRGKIDRSELPAIGSSQTADGANGKVLQVGYALSFGLGILGLLFFLVV